MIENSDSIALSIATVSIIGLVPSTFLLPVRG